MKQCSLHAHIFALPLRLPRRVPGSQVVHGRTSPLGRAQASPVQTRPVPSPVPGGAISGEEASLKRVFFEVTREVAVGEEVMVVGSAPELGEWNHLNGVKLEWHPGHVWRGSVSVADAVIQYKFVKVPEDLAFAEWEGGDDRTANLNEISSPGISISSCWGQPESYSSATPLQNDSYGTTGNGGVAEEIDAAAVPTYTARIAIQKELCLGQHLKLVGSSPVLGSWRFPQAPAFTWTPDNIWQLELELPVDTPVDWKVVQAVEGSNDWCQWQSGENTIVDPALLGLKEGDTLEVGCTWDGESRASILSTPQPASAATVAAVAAVADVVSGVADSQRMITVKEEAVYGSDSDSSDEVRTGAPKASAEQAAPVLADAADEAAKQAEADAVSSEESKTAQLAAEAAAAAKAASEEVMAAKAKKLHAAIAAAEKAEADKARAEKAEAERARAEKVLAEKAEVEKVKAEAEKAAAEKAEAEKAEADKVAAEKAAAEADKIAIEKVKAEKAAAEKAEKVKAEAEKAALEKAEAEKVAAEKVKAEKAEAEKAEADKAAAEKAEAEKAEAEKAAAEKAKAEKAEADKAAAEKAEAEKAEAEKAAAEKAKAEKAEADKAAAEKAEAEKAEAEKVAAEKAEKVKAQKAAAEKAEAEKAAAKKAEAEKAEAEKIAADKAKVKSEAERAAVEKAEAEKAEAKKAKAEKAKAEEAAAAAAEKEKAAIDKAAGDKVKTEEAMTTTAMESKSEDATSESPGDAKEEVQWKKPWESDEVEQATQEADAKGGSPVTAASTEAHGAVSPPAQGAAGKDGIAEAAQAKRAGGSVMWPSAAVVAAAGLDMSEDLGYTSDEEVVQALEAQAEEAAQAKAAALEQAEAAEADAAAATAAAVHAEGRLAVLEGLASEWPLAKSAPADATGAKEAPPDSEGSAAVAEGAEDAAASVPPFAQPGDMKERGATANVSLDTTDQKAAGQTALPTALPQSAQDWPMTADRSAQVPEGPPADAPWAVRDTAGADGAALASSDRLHNGDALAAGLEDMVLTPEQLAVLAEAGAPPAGAAAAEVEDDGTFQLQKGRLDVSEDGSTVVVRGGGHEYDSETGTVTVTTPLSQGPDGLLTDSNGVLIEDPGSVRAEDVADVRPEDEVGLIGRVGAYAGMAAAGLGAATLAGGIAVDVTDVALIAGVYGVATAIGSSRNAAIRAKGAAGPVLSAFVTAADLARRIQGKGPEKPRTAAHERLGKYERSRRADVSSQSESAAEVTQVMAAVEAETEAQARVAAQEEARAMMVKRVATRAEEMRRKLGPKGMQALEDGVNQVMTTDVQRILKALDSNLSDEDKVAHLVKMLLNDDPSAWKTPELAKIEIRAAICLAAEHLEAVGAAKLETQRAPLVLLAALAMSAVDEMRGVKTA